MTVYYDTGSIPAGQFPSILAIGDSWFWYPLPTGQNLLEQLSNLVLKDAYKNIFSLGQVGATLKSYVDGKYAKRFNNELKPGNAIYYSAVFISGAGNDAVDYGLCLRNDCRGLSADDCIDPDKLDLLLRRLSGYLGQMIHDIRWAYQGLSVPQPYIYMHCYDYAPPNGKGVGLGIGPWLAPAMNACQVDDSMEVRQQIIVLMMQRLRDTFARFDSDQNRVHLVDSLGTLDPAKDWDNELHPKTAGFRKLAEGPWARTLKKDGFA
jgi:hypothetical protein